MFPSRDPTPGTSDKKNWLARIDRPKTVLVTGGAGFLGSHLCERLLQSGSHVICVDNLLTGRLSNVQHLLDHKRFELIKADVAQPLDFDVDEIYNLASPASPVDYQADPIRTTRTNVLGALNVLELAVRTNATVLQASTSEVYGDPMVHPQSESYWGNVNPTGPRACYDEGKRCAETLFFDFARQHNLRIRVARVFNTYGPRMRLDDGRVVSNFVSQALRGDDITIHGDGAQTRSFCYVDDLIEGFVRLMRSPDHVVGPVNLGNPQEFTVRELADLVIAMAESRSRLVYLPMPQDDPMKRRPDISRARELLDWTPRIDLKHGLSIMIDHFLSVLPDTGPQAVPEWRKPAIAIVGEQDSNTDNEAGSMVGP